MKAKQGFTIVELSLATVFLAVLLLMIATITINISVIYQKGVTLRNVNAAGRNIVDDLDRAIADAPPVRFTPTGTKSYFRAVNGKVSIQHDTDSKDKDYQYRGVFCSGRYSYVWNTGYALNSAYGVSTSLVKIKYSGGTMGDTGNDQTPIHLAKFADPNRAACSDDNFQNFQNNGWITIDTLTDAPEDLLSGSKSQQSLALYEMMIFPVSQDSVSLRSFHSGTFVLATLVGDVDIKASGDYCDPSNSQSLAGDFAYCAVNKFNFAAQASRQ